MDGEVLPEEADGRPWVGDEVEAGDGEEGSAGEKPGKPEVEAEAAGSQGEKEDGPVEPPPPKAPSQAVARAAKGRRPGARTRHSIREKGSALIKLRSCRCCADDDAAAFAHSME
ncbi:unnamed protein product [Durusdinium trenchii]|uniref:tRNA:m(4)X modification enzyme TRM13 n=1 Tax=Durusdinium trenchii TaxID=1381693 RepID=A0ABP0QJB0_9DINO